MADSDGEEDFHFWGTPVEDEEEMRAGQHRKVGLCKRASSMRQGLDQCTVSCALASTARSQVCWLPRRAQVWRCQFELRPAAA